MIPRPPTDTKCPLYKTRGLGNNDKKNTSVHAQYRCNHCRLTIQSYTSATMQYFSSIFSPHFQSASIGWNYRCRIHGYRGPTVYFLRYQMRVLTSALCGGCLSTIPSSLSYNLCLLFPTCGPLKPGVLADFLKAKIQLLFSVAFLPSHGLQIPVILYTANPAQTYIFHLIYIHTFLIFINFLNHYI